MTATDSESKPLTQLLSLQPGAARSAIGDLVAAVGQPTYRVDQIFDWMYARRARSFEEMTNLPSDLRERLIDEFTLTPACRSFEARSKDGTCKERNFNQPHANPYCSGHPTPHPEASQRNLLREVHAVEETCGSGDPTPIDTP